MKKTFPEIQTEPENFANVQRKVAFYTPQIGRVYVKIWS